MRMWWRRCWASQRANCLNLIKASLISAFAMRSIIQFMISFDDCLQTIKSSHDENTLKASRYFIFAANRFMSIDFCCCTLISRLYRFQANITEPYRELSNRFSIRTRRAFPRILQSKKSSHALKTRRTPLYFILAANRARLIRFSSLRLPATRSIFHVISAWLTLALTIRIMVRVIKFLPPWRQST